VRRLVGVLVAIGRGDLAPADVDRLLRGGGRGPTPAQLTAPASGLFLARVFYEGDDRSVPVVPVLNVSPSLEPDTASSREPSSAVGRRP
jgi:tRNA U38,U39,U40 pseudouridine synthase TruA